MKRRCGRTPAAQATPARVVWARKGVATKVCPRSYISGESMAWLEEFETWRRIGFPDLQTMTARQAHAIVILQQEFCSEAQRGEQ
jgi:hypothetical protein